MAKRITIFMAVYVLLCLWTAVTPLAAELIIPVTVNCSEEVSEVPELFFTDAAYQSYGVPLTGTVPGTLFQGELVLGSSVAEGVGTFSIALVDLAGNLGNSITGGGTLYIDPPVDTPTPTATATDTPTSTPTNTPTNTPAPTDTPTSTPTATPTQTPTPILEMVVSGPSGSMEASVAPDGNGRGEGEAVFAVRADAAVVVNEIGLMRWSLNGLPEARQVRSASVELTVAQNNTAAAYTLQLRPLTQARPYLPGCDWEKYNGLDDWPVDNAYLTAQAETVLTAVTVNPGDTQVVLELTGLLQQWLEGTLDNHGFMLVAVRGSADVDCTFHASEAIVSGMRPRLRIRYVGSEPNGTDTIAPQGVVAFAGAGAVTNVLEQQLTLSASDDQTNMAAAGYFRLSLDNTVWSSLLPLSSPYPCLLSGTDGWKRIYVEFADEAGNVSLKPAAAEIILDRTEPTAEVVVGS